jgi:hypothetical protein
MDDPTYLNLYKFIIYEQDVDAGPCLPPALDRPVPQSSIPLVQDSHHFGWV